MYKLFIILGLLQGCATTYDIRERCAAYHASEKIWINPYTTLTVMEIRPGNRSVVYHGYLNYFGLPTDEIANYRGPLCR